MRELISVILFNVILFTYASDRIIGVWDWHSNGNDIREAKVLFRRDGIAIYKIWGVDPIEAKWELVGKDTLVVCSDYFIWDYRYHEMFPNEYELWYDSIYSPYVRGKLLDSPGDTEVYILKDSLLIPINKHEHGWLKNSSIDSLTFHNYKPSTKQFVCRLNNNPVSYYHDFLMNTTSKHIAQKNDSLLIKSIEYTRNPGRNKPLNLLADLPREIDSIEFKMVDVYGDHDYFAIDRKAFDQTFDYLLDNTDDRKYKVTHIITKDTIVISLLCELLKESIPFPSEAVQITPNNAWRQSHGDEGNHGIYTDKNLNNDPLEVRGKIIIYSNGRQIVSFISPLSIDILSHRYEQSNRMARFLFMMEALQM